MTVHDVRLSEDIEQNAQGGPGFLTTIVSMGSGLEQRNAEWERAKQRWDIAYGVQSKTDFQEVLAFFYARHGRFYGFKFKDWSDYTAADQLVGTGDSTDGSDGTSDFQLVKIYADSAGSFSRKITRPVTGTVVVKVDGVVDNNWTLGSLGVISFTAGHHPLTGLEVTASFEFDVPVRFDVDRMNVALIWANAGGIPQLEIVEIVE